MDEKTQALNVFYSYADTAKDRALYEQLEQHLSILKRLDLIKDWRAQNIQAGIEWERTALTQLNNAQIILLLISADFIASDYCYSKVMRHALDRQKAGEAHVIPILLRPVERRGTPFESLKALPSDGKPITRWLDQDEAFADIAAGIRYVIENEPKLRQNLSVTNHDEFTILYKTTPLYPTINTYDGIALFHQLMRQDGNLRILYLVGEGKMGKSHLLTKVFPHMVQKDQVCYVTFDLGNQFYGVPETLKKICDLISPEKFKEYNAAYQSWSDKSMNTKTLFSFGKQRLDNSDRTDFYLTQQFVNDIRLLSDRPLLLLFDSINKASKHIQKWLANDLLVQLARLPHVRTVVASRTLPFVNESYAEVSTRYQMRPVVEENEYFDYCHKTELMLDESAIYAIARGLDYIPGAFVDFVVPKFLNQRVLHG